MEMLPPPKPFAAWSRDTERAFLLALRLTGQATKAAGEIGRSLSTAYKRRQRDPAFRAAWDAAVAEQQAEWLAAAQGEGAAEDRLEPGQARFDGWIARRRRLFLAALGETGNVREACRRAGISDTAAYLLRKRSRGFAREWGRALEDAGKSVEQAAYERAVEGWEEPIVAGGKVIGTRRRYSDALLRALLLARLGEGGGGKGKGKAAAAPAATRAFTPGEIEVARMLKARGVKPALVTAALEAARAAGGYFMADATREETNAVLTRLLDMVKKKKAAMAREAAQGEVVEEDVEDVEDAGDC